MQSTARQASVEVARKWEGPHHVLGRLVSVLALGASHTADIQEVPVGLKTGG